MTPQELSDEFDVLINAYEAGSITLNEYEKSIFLTKAQEEIVLELYKGTFVGESFETTEELRRYLSPFIETYETITTENKVGISPNSTFFKLPPLEDGSAEHKHFWVIIHESVDLEKTSCKDSSYVSVYPVTHDEYHKIKNNPFRNDSQHRVLRIDSSKDSIELISKIPIVKYRMRYLRRPKGIRTTGFSEFSLNINGNNTLQPCELHPILHHKVVERAVALAIASRTSSNKE